MKAKVSGFTVPKKVLEDILSGDFANREAMNPELNAITFARISHSPSDIDGIRDDAIRDIEGRHKSGDKIYLQMGHKSIGEHAVFNIDVEDVSRLLVEYIENFRLASYTEKSQRYVKIDPELQFHPESIITSPSRNFFFDNLKKQVEFYQNNITEKNSENLSPIEQWHVDNGGKKDSAKEDARYSLGFTTYANLGMTINTRELELMILRMKTLPLDEARDFAHILEKIAKPHAPTLLKYTNHTDQEVKVHSDLKKIADFYLFNGGVKSDFSEKGVKMHKFDDIDDPIIAGLFFTHSDYDFSSIKKTVEKMSKKEKMEVLSTAQAKYKKHFESPMREFELGNMKYVFEIQTSASGFAQHKRQRMNTILTQRYNPALGVVIPPSISGSGLEKELREVTDASSELHIELYEAGIKRHAAEYALTNAHKRRILLGANMRQILQIANNREDAHAQWEIRQHISSIDDLLRKKSLSAAFACGKDVSEGISEIFRVSYCK